MMMYRIIVINSCLQKFVIIKRFMILLEKKSLAWCYLIIRFFHGKIWGVEKFYYMDIHYVSAEESNFISSV